MKKWRSPVSATKIGKRHDWDIESAVVHCVTGTLAKATLRRALGTPNLIRLPAPGASPPRQQFRRERVRIAIGGVERTCARLRRSAPHLQPNTTQDYR